MPAPAVPNKTKTSARMRGGYKGGKITGVFYRLKFFTEESYEKTYKHCSCAGLVFIYLMR